MKEAELRRYATCSMCGQKIGHTGLPLFWRVTVERFGIDHAAVARQQGLAMFLGNAAIAGVMGPDETMAQPVMDPVTLSVCETCVIEQTCIAQLAELQGVPAK